MQCAATATTKTALRRSGKNNFFFLQKETLQEIEVQGYFSVRLFVERCDAVRILFFIILVILLKKFSLYARSIEHGNCAKCKINRCMRK